MGVEVKFLLLPGRHTVYTGALINYRYKKCFNLGIRYENRFYFIDQQFLNMVLSEMEW